MALYQPLRDAFNDLNNMIVDSQQWDARHAAQEADNEYRHAVQMAALDQQKFQRDMSVKAYDLRVAGDARAEKAAKELIKNNNRNYELGKQEYTLRQDKFAAAEETRKINNQIASEELKKLKIPSTPVTLDFNGIISPRLAKNARFMTEANEWLATQNMVMGEDLIVMSPNADGEYEERQMSPNDQAKFAPMLQGLIAKYDNPNDNAKEDMVILAEYRSELLKEAKDMPGGYTHAAAAHTRRQIKQLDAEINSQKEAFKPENMKESYKRRASEMYGAAMWLRQQGLMDDADGFEAGAKEMLDKWSATDKASKGQLIETWKRGLNKKGSSIPAESVVWDPIKEMYSRTVTDPDTGETVREYAPQVKDWGLTTDEPKAMSDAERGIGTSGTDSPRDDISIDQMKTFKNFNRQGMNAQMFDNVSKPVIRELSMLATEYVTNGSLDGQAKPNLLAHQKAKAFQHKTEMSYHKDISKESVNEVLRNPEKKLIAFTKAMETYTYDLKYAIENKLGQDRIDYLQRRIANVAASGKKKILARKEMLEFAKYEYQSAWRNELDDDMYEPYIPTDMTKGMLTGD